MPPRPDNACQWTDQRFALRTFATYTGQTQSQAHIKPLHWYVACRLVVEGGFLPEEITPRPPFRAQRRQGWELIYDPEVAGGGEATILGGLKTKDVDVVVTKDGIGPDCGLMQGRDWCLPKPYQPDGGGRWRLH
jgi:hypothetical protein